MAAPEKRFTATTLRVERRDAGDGKPAEPEIVGHAAVYDQWTTLYEGRYWTWREIIRPGAFTNALREGQDVRALWNHDPNFILGRTKSGTLTLTDDPPRGLLSRTRPPGTQTVNDLVLVPIDRRDVDGMSFAFGIRAGDGKVTRTENADGTIVVVTAGERVTLRYEGERLIEEREVLDADLYDVSPVVYPAYGGTDVDLRSITGAAERAKSMDVPHARRSAAAMKRHAHARLRLALAAD